MGKTKHICFVLRGARLDNGMFFVEKLLRMAVCTDMQNFLNSYVEVGGCMVAQQVALPTHSSRDQVAD